MIVEAILTVVLTPVGWVLAVIPEISWPDWMVAETSPILSAFQWLGHGLSFFSGWIDTVALVNVLTFLLGLWAIVNIVKGVRFVVSLVTGGGGA